MIKLKSLLSELTHRQKEAKKDYLFRQTKLRSSNTVPTFSEIWKELSKTDGIKYEIQWQLDAIPLTTEPVDKEAIRDRMMKEMEDVQRSKYFEIVQTYKELDGQWCWRNIILPQSVDPRKLEQLGVYWAIQEDAAEAHWGKHTGAQSFDCTYEALIDLHNVDWSGTMFARMCFTGGDDEQEIRFLKNAPLLVRKVEVYDNAKEQRFDYFINNRRRA